MSEVTRIDLEAKGKEFFSSPECERAIREEFLRLREESSWKRTFSERLEKVVEELSKTVCLVENRQPAVYSGGDIRAYLVGTPVNKDSALNFFREFCPARIERESTEAYFFRRRQWKQDRVISLPEMISIEFSSEYGSIKGRLSCVLFEESLSRKLKDEGKTLLLIAASETGSTSVSAFSNFEVTGWSWKMGENDLQSQEVFEFTCSGILPWTRIL